jgi:hypothetical protein
MASNMKTTVEISDALLDEARRVAARSGTTVRALIEEGLRGVLTQRRRGPTFRLRPAAFRGQGPQPGVREGDWDQIRALSYDERGA